MDYHCYQFITSQPDILLAFLGQLPFDTFETTTAGLKAYLPRAEDRPAVKREVAAIAARFGATYEVEPIPAQNWNAVWEAGFSPIRVDDFVGIRADFHPPTEGVRYDLLINPKMAFGTGHHATTYQMVQVMRTLHFANARVLDYGCGTGVLAILARKLGASYVEAVDIEQPAYENALVNTELNGTPGIRVVHGTLADVQRTRFDLILANINRHVILASLPELHQKLTAGGTLLLSGILEADEELVRGALAENGFALTHRQAREGWCCLAATPKLAQGNPDS